MKTYEYLLRAVTLWFHTGQLASMPALIGRYRAKAGPARVDLDTLPGGSASTRGA